MSPLRRLLNACLALPVVVVVLLRANDVVWFHAEAAEAVGPAALIGATAAALAGLVGWSSLAPGRAAVAGVAAFAVLKQAADSVPAPTLSHQAPLTVLVTGANSGIGLAVSAEVARQGHTVVMACRSQAKCDSARDSIVRDLVQEAEAKLRAARELWQQQQDEWRSRHEQQQQQQRDDWASLLRSLAAPGPRISPAEPELSAAEATLLGCPPPGRFASP